MSSCKLWRDRQLGQRRGDKSCSISRKTPSLLRLDSTGEVTSVKTTSEQYPNMCRGKEGFCVTRKQKKLSIQSVVNSFSVSSISMMNTASSYLNSATSYIESMCTYKTRQCLVNSSAPCMSSDISSVNLGRIFENGCIMSKVNKGCKVPQPESAGGPYSHAGCQMKKAWTQEIIGALHSTVFSKEVSHANSIKPDKYIPPPVKNRILQEKQCSDVYKRDPKLTPYNAKLLEKSKRKENPPQNKAICRNLNRLSGVCHPKHAENNEVNSVTNPFARSNADQIQSTTAKRNADVINDKSQEKIDLKPMQSKCELKEEVVCDSSHTDWFEYENEDEKVIPLKVNEELLERAEKSKNVIGMTSDQSSDSQDRMLHSWYSMDNDTEIKKSKCAQHIPLLCSSSHKLCDKSCYSVTGSHSDPRIHMSAVKNQKVATDVNQESNNETKVEYDTKSNNGYKKQHEDIDRKTELISVLYVRNCSGQKRRPSAQKRSRHKAQKNSNNGETSSKPLKEGNSIHPNSSVAFILGLDHEQSDSCFSMQPFQVNCDIDELDWSSCDEGDSQIDDIVDCDGFNFFSPLKNLVNFQVTCSGPSTLATSYSNHSLLDRINLEWEIDNSMKQKNLEKKTCKSKKVHFQNDKTLNTVHQMITWAYAYQAARKGPWEEIARDRGRFQRRITDGEKLLKPILQTVHRNNVFRDRFESDL